MAKIYATKDPVKSKREEQNEQRSRQIAAQTMDILSSSRILYPVFRESTNASFLFYFGN